MSNPKNDDSYVDGDPDPPDPFDGCHFGHAKKMSKPTNDDGYVDGDPDPPDPCDC